MATSEDYIKFVCDQLAGMGAVRRRKMFGEYIVYVNDKPLLLVCDSTVFVKMLPELAEVLAGAEIALPYKGGKLHYILDIENRELLQTVVGILEPITPLPRRKRNRDI
jgi:TfoX/Sxy family transcriptional regulator of competence genes